MQTLMTLANAKKAMGLTQLNLSRQLAEDQQTPTEFLTHWDNEKRIRVIVHQNVVNTAKEQPNAAIFFLKKSDEASKSGQYAGVMYTKYILCTANVEVTL